MMLPSGPRSACRVPSSRVISESVRICSISASVSTTVVSSASCMTKANSCTGSNGRVETSESVSPVVTL